MCPESGRTAAGMTMGGPSSTGRKGAGNKGRKRGKKTPETGGKNGSEGAAKVKFREERQKLTNGFNE